MGAISTDRIDTVERLDWEIEVLSWPGREEGGRRRTSVASGLAELRSRL